MKSFKSKKILIVLLSGSLLFSSCIGSFGLFNKVRAWNEGVSENKFVNELLFFALLVVPVYEICAIADLLVINSIEFWSGENPMHTANAGDIKMVKGENEIYLVETLENGYSIQKEGDEENFQLIFNKEDKTWNAVSENHTSPLLKMNGDGTAKLFLPDGSTLDVTLDHPGTVAARKVLMNNYYVMR